jgi:hypothetical protein
MPCGVRYRSTIHFLHQIGHSGVLFKRILLTQPLSLQVNSKVSITAFPRTFDTRFW